ncbi:clavesin-1-like [Planococcus citri]|uniref:clavesin-1-like n=1 Tax=Planococcus citri TaxID=170843 RepID=UPI0031F86BA0
MESERESTEEMELCPEYAINELKFWISQQNFIPELSDKVLRRFLHSCYYNVKDTKDTLTSYFSIRVKTSQVFLNRTAEHMKGITDLGYYVKMPEVTVEGYEVIVTGLFTDDTTHFNFTDFLKLYITAVETWTFTAQENSEGIILVADAANFTFSHLRKMEYNVIKAGFQYFQDALPIRLKKIIIINISTPVNVLLNMMQSVIAKRLVHLIERHSSTSTKYYEMVPQKMFPMEYGGDGRSVKDLNGETVQLLIDNKEWLEKEDEMLRNLIAKQPRQKSFFSSLF